MGRMAAFGAAIGSDADIVAAGEAEAEFRSATRAAVAAEPKRGRASGDQEDEPEGDGHFGFIPIEVSRGRVPWYEVSNPDLLPIEEVKT